VRIKELQNQARRYFNYSETLLARLAPFLRKEAVEKEAAKKAAEKEATENPVARVIFIMSYFYFNNLHFNY
jgi:uncharacterized membrane protein